ncbi:hypothetical protein PMNALOAF_0932 [Methylobacterium adhaesivum]|uniref:Uncharacterized protein n=1 Tax=Methylobacterium adhaesivum TaxID=333297 RepID=A0ABT8BHH0_9HYPH|nr:hypothetical protein [Methylobacterium adhaesivum]MDN3590917.1 hypothetical protein [Methylobacterium adhaesivum]GJD29695.1 hypothetical protein PMNALOAF_0932 [Methylobacterium adhaesivum]
MDSVPARMDNVVPFRRATPQPPPARPGSAVRATTPASRRSDQRAVMDAVYATGTLAVAAGDRETKLIAARLQVYGFLIIEEIDTDGTFRRLRPSEAIRARSERPWRVTKASYGASLSVTIPAVDGFLFEQPA